MAMEGSSYSTPSTARQSGRTLLSRALRTRDLLPVVLKTFIGRQPHPKDIARLDNEYRIASQLDSPAVVRPLALEAGAGVAMLVLEDFGGEPLELQLGSPLSVDTFLDLAIGITSTIAEIHRRGVIHRDIKPDSILVNPTTRQVKITDFGIAMLLPREHTVATRPSFIEGTLAYMAPEQTGRMNRPVDARSDLYSLGVVFYRMLTGRAPFQAADPLEWIHCHIARSPLPPSSATPELPIALSELVLKLLAKDPEQRYQSADGLKRDLERCRDEWRSRGRITPFVLGEHDAFDRFRLPRTLYGREAELAALRGALHRVATTGQAVLVLVRGGAGIGKSSLVRELHKHVIEEEGVYLEGKFEQLRTVPYGPILQAVREVVLDVLAEDDVQRGRWQTDLMAALGGNAKLIIDVIPQLALIIGDQPDVPELARGDAEKRFRRVFRDFLGVFARPERPLVLFLDDLHWVDSSSLTLIEEVVGHTKTRNLLLIGAYRDNEVSPSHPLVEAENRLQEHGTCVETLSLLPLAEPQVAALVADTLRMEAERPRELASVIHEKTGGNPFFVIQVLKELRRDGPIWFDDAHRDWQWDISRIRRLPYTNNVVDLLVRKLGTLPPATQEALKIAACLGNQRSLEMLALASDKREEAVLRDLWDAVREGLLVLTPDSYAFVHDRMQQAAYSKIPVPDRRSVHLRIGQLMHEHTPEDRRDERLFDIATQLNLGASLLESREERKTIAELDLLAGRKARASSAFGSALEYFTAGAALLDHDAWHDCYELKYALELDRAECDWLTGQPERARVRLEEILEHARSRIDKGSAAEILVAVHLTMGAIGKDIEVALPALRSLGIDISTHPEWNDVVAEYQAVLAHLREHGLSIEDVVDLPPMTDPESQLAMRLLSILYGPALWSDSNLFAYHLCKMVRLSLEKGNTGYSTHGYGWFGILAAHVFRRYDDAVRWAKAGYALMARSYPAMRSKAEFFMEIGAIWTQSLDTVLEHAHAAARAGLDMGDVPVSSWCRTHVVHYRLLRGDPLQDVEHEATTCLEIVRERGVLDSVYVVLDALRYIRALRGTTAPAGSAEPSIPEGVDWLAERCPTMVCWHHLTDMVIRFLFGDYEAAREAGAQCEQLLWSCLGHVQVYEFHLYYALTLAALHDGLPPSEHGEVESKVQALHARIAEWASQNPTTFSAGSALVDAERARLRGAPIEAARLYAHAAQLARDHGFVQVEALAYELAARFYRTQGIAPIADSQLRDARDCYLRWGASGKAAQLESTSASLMKSVFAPPTTVAIPSVQIDLVAVAKASQTISREVVWEKVTEALLDVVLEQSGAQKGCLLFRRDGPLVVELEATPTANGVAVTRPGIPATDSRRIPVSIVSYAWKTQSAVLLEDAARSTRFGKDPYLTGSHARSVLCLPILLHGSTAGLIYLENNLVAGAFTQDRLTALELLAGQAAISLRNAQLLAQESAARSRAEEAERRSTFLAKAGALLNESLDYDSISSRLARLVVGAHHADLCTIQLLENARIRRSGFAHASPEKERALAEMIGRFPLHIESSLPSVTAIRTGAIQVLTGLSDERLRQICNDGEQARMLRKLGMQNVLAAPLVARGKVLGSIALARGGSSPGYGPADIELVEELAHRAALAVDNARLHRETREAVRLRDEFLAVASHELNTPMTSLVLTLQALVQTKIELSPERRHELAIVAERQAGRLTALIRELLDVTRIERTAIELSPETIDLQDLIREGLRRFAAELDKAHCSVSLVATESVVGEWDHSRLEQVVTNLLANAVKFGVGKPIEVELGIRDGKAYFEVTDHGIGIEASDQARIFERFERAVSVRHYGGLGLGLYICRQIVEAHGGTIRVRSAPGAGATFIVELPLVTRVEHGRSRT